MATLSNNDIAEAIHLVSLGKSGNELNEEIKKIVRFLKDRGLLSKSRDILEKLDGIINKELGKVVVKVYTKDKLRDKLKIELNTFLKERYKAKEIILEERQDERLIGGVRIEIGDEIIDLSVKNKIKKLQEHLIRKI